MKRSLTKAIYFSSPIEFRKWLSEHHATASELSVGFHKRATSTPSLTWPESVDEALCVGWIDGVRKRVDDARYTIRFTPRKPTSIWSKINIARVAVLEREGRMHDAGRSAFAKRRENKTATYSYENRPGDLEPADLAKLRKNKEAYAFWRAQPPWYRRTATWWIVSAKKEETRATRLEKLIDASAAGRRV